MAVSLLTATSLLAIVLRSEVIFSLLEFLFPDGAAVFCAGAAALGASAAFGAALAF